MLKLAPHIPFPLLKSRAEAHSSLINFESDDNWAEKDRKWIGVDPAQLPKATCTLPELMEHAHDNNWALMKIESGGKKTIIKFVDDAGKWLERPLVAEKEGSNPVKGFAELENLDRVHDAVLHPGSHSIYCAFNNGKKSELSIDAVDKMLKDFKEELQKLTDHQGAVAPDDEACCRIRDALYKRIGELKCLQDELLQQKPNSLNEIKPSEEKSNNESVSKSEGKNLLPAMNGELKKEPSSQMPFSAA